MSLSPVEYAPPMPPTVPLVPSTEEPSNVVENRLNNQFRDIDI